MRFRSIRLRTAFTLSALLALLALLALGCASAQETTPLAGLEPTLALVIPTESHTLTAAATARSAGLKTSPAPFGEGWKAVSDASLTEIRGGFLTNTGVKISFGIERAVYVNGELVTSTRFGVSQISPSAPGITTDVGGAMILIQNGVGNPFLPGPSASTPAGTVVQNTLDHQSIRTVTVIDASLNSLERLRSINLESNLRNSIANSLHR